MCPNVSIVYWSLSLKFDFFILFWIFLSNQTGSLSSQKWPWPDKWPSYKQRLFAGLQEVHIAWAYPCFHSMNEVPVHCRVIHSMKIQCYEFIHLGGEEYCKGVGKLSYPRMQCVDPSQGSSAITEESSALTIRPPWLVYLRWNGSCLKLSLWTFL